MKPVGVLANCSKPSAPEVLGHFAETARKLGLKLAATADAAPLLPGALRLTLKNMMARIGLLMVFGGDGTMLRAVRALDGRAVPVLGVNLGSLGFLTSVAQQDTEKALALFLAGRCRIGRRCLADCVVRRSGKIIGRYRALNDVIIDRGASARIVTLAMRIKNEAVSSFMCDGLIISTPTGSTGHCLSAGGPILHPDTDMFVVSPICPHTLSTRPLVIPNDRTITVEVEKSSGDLRLAVDGQVGEPLRPRDLVAVRRSRATAHFVHLPDYSYFRVLRQKLHWRGSTLV